VLGQLLAACGLVTTLTIDEPQLLREGPGTLCAGWQGGGWVGRGINGHEEIPVGGQLTSLLAVS
jgi:hypothetical protein